MSSAHSDVNVYSRDGRIMQVESAMKACNLGTTTIGVKLSDCVILVSEKKLTSPNQIPDSMRKHIKVYGTILVGVAGVSGDARTIVRKCRDICIRHEKLFCEQIASAKLMEDICDLALKFSEEKAEKKIFARPFGVALLVAVFEHGRPVLYCIDPSGSYHEYKARAIGSASEVVENILVGTYQDMSEKNAAIKKLLEILKGVMKDKLTKDNVEVSVVDEHGVVLLTADQITEYM